MPTIDRMSYCTSTATATSDTIQGVIGRIETLLGEREAQAKAALADFKMTHSDSEYERVEQRWQQAASETRQIIALVRGTIDDNTNVAMNLQTKVSGCIANIG